jgi:hypothetical protein
MAMKSITLQFTTEQLLTEHAMYENQLLETLTALLQQINIITGGFYVLGTEPSTTGLPQPTIPPSGGVNQTKTIFYIAASIQNQRLVFTTHESGLSPLIRVPSS